MAKCHVTSTPTTVFWLRCQILPDPIARSRLDLAKSWQDAHLSSYPVNSIDLFMNQVGFTFVYENVNVFRMGLSLFIVYTGVAYLNNTRDHTLETNQLLILGEIMFTTRHLDTWQHIITNTLVRNVSVTIAQWRGGDSISGRGPRSSEFGWENILPRVECVGEKYVWTLL
jgi:hypothetical protein